jgi:hypothetical protein
MRLAYGTNPAIEKSAIASLSPTSQVFALSESLSIAAKRAKFCSPHAKKAGPGTEPEQRPSKLSQTTVPRDSAPQ